MSDEWQEYVQDARTVCKYGSKCYQKNPDHHKSFKHPPQKVSKHANRIKRRFEPYSKQIRKDTDKAEHQSVGDKTEETIKEASSSNEGKIDETNPNEHKEDEANRSIILLDNITFYDKKSDPKIIEELFLVEMPDDFFKFFECFGDQDVQKTLSSVNLELIGPYDLLLGKLPMLDDKELYLIHWRFFFDPPEFQAVLKKKNSEYHIGYFRDEPKQKPVFLGSNDSSKDCHITPMANNIFGAVYLYLQNEKKHSPFTAVLCQKLMNKIKSYAEEHKFSLEEYTLKKRLSHIVTKTFHGAGIVVPYNKKTQLGYRRLVETDANIKKLFTSLKQSTTQSEKDKILSDIQPVITYASIAVDECDFGTGLEIGIDLFCSGLKELEPSALSNLSTTYNLLNRGAFSSIIQAHLKNRRKGPCMSLLSLNDKH